jgi:hypothetical protein
MMAARKVHMPLPVLVSQTPLSSGALATTSARLFTIKIGAAGVREGETELDGFSGEETLVDMEPEAPFFAKEAGNRKVPPATNTVAVVTNNKIASRGMKCLTLISTPSPSYWRLG